MDFNADEVRFRLVSSQGDQCVTIAKTDFQCAGCGASENSVKLQAGAEGKVSPRTVTGDYQLAIGGPQPFNMFC